MHGTSDNTRFARKTLALATPAVVAMGILAIALVLDNPDAYTWHASLDPAQDLRISSSFTSGIMIICGPLLVLWAASLYMRCTYLSIRKYFVWIPALCILWLLAVLVKYVGASDLPASLLWYFYYVPMGLIPLMLLFVSLRMATYEENGTVRAMRVVCTVITVALIVLVLTNNIHHQVFAFDFSNPSWVSDYSYGWGYWAFTIWSILLYVAFFALLFRIAHLRLRGLFAPAILVGLLGLVYAALYALRIGNIFAGNFSLTYIIMLVACIELMFRLGLLPSFSGYREAFDELPFDAKILTKDLVVTSVSKNASMLPDDIKPTLGEFVASGEGNLSFRTSAHPNYSYEVLRQRGGIALFTEDRSVINAQREKLEGALEATKARIAVLENSVAVQGELYRLSSERDLLDAIDDQLGSTVDTICRLLDSISESTPFEERGHTLAFVRLLVGYCKRMGGFVLADADRDAFDPERLALVMGDTAADARASGISCASLVSIREPLPKRSVLVLYNCMYEILIIAFQHMDSAVMFNVAQRDGESIGFSAVLEVSAEKEIAGSETAEQLRVMLSAYGMPYSLDSDEETLRVCVVLPAHPGASGGEG